MAKRSKSKKLVKSVDLDLDDISALEGVIVPNFDGFFESVRITSEQLSGFADTVASLARAYDSFAIPLRGAMQEFAKSQQRIAEAIAEFSRNAALNQMEIVIRSFRIPEFPKLNFPIPELQPVQIFVQPAPSYIPPKVLPAPKRKQELQLTAINIEGNGFTINGEYIGGMTRKSLPGRLFELMIQKDLDGVIPDTLIDSILGLRADDNRALSFVLRDLKDILAGNKLKLNMKRYRAIEKYAVSNITKYIRAPRKKKKLAKTAKTN